jgi:cell division protein FtsX
MESNPLHKFFFLKPKANTNANDIAEKLLSLKNVQEVILTEGDIGYIVKTRLFSEREDAETRHYIEKNVGQMLGFAVSFDSLKK